MRDSLRICGHEFYFKIAFRFQCFTQSLYVNVVWWYIIQAIYVFIKDGRVCVCVCNFTRRKNNMEKRLHVNGRKKIKISYANHVLGHHIYSKLEFLSCMNIIIWFRISRPTSVQFFYFRSAMPCFAKNLPK